VGCAPLEQLDLDLADAAADLEHARSRDSALLEELDHPPGGLVETALAVALRHPAGEPGTEELVTASRVAAARHGSARRSSGSVLASGHSTIAGSGNTRWLDPGRLLMLDQIISQELTGRDSARASARAPTPCICNTIRLAPCRGAYGYSHWPEVFAAIARRI
jgi:hypothetical protein